MQAYLDPTKLKGYQVSPLTNTYLIPQRHVCGRIVFADLNGEYAVFYTRYAVTGHRNILLSGKKPIENCPHCNYPLSMDWMRPLYHIQPMPYPMALQTKARRVCSNCWGPLEIINHHIPVLNEESGLMEEHALIWCPLCKYETIGYVTERYTQEARRSDQELYTLCVNGLSEVLGLEIPKRENKSVKQSMEELGF